METDSGQPTLAAMMETLRSVSDEAWGRYAFSREMLRERIPAGEIPELIGESLRCGEEYACRVMRETGRSTARDVAERLGVTVEPDTRPAGGARRILFARFTPPRTIDIMREPLARYAQLLPTLPPAESAALPDADGVYDMLLGHELFHYAEESHASEIYTRRRTIRLWKIFGFENRTTIRALSEIAAMAFARTLCRVGYSPFALDVLLFYSYDKSNARRIYDHIMERCTGPV